MNPRKSQNMRGIKRKGAEHVIGTAIVRAMDARAVGARERSLYWKMQGPLETPQNPYRAAAGLPKLRRTRADRTRLIRGHRINECAVRTTVSQNAAFAATRLSAWQTALNRACRDRREDRSQPIHSSRARL